MLTPKKGLRFNLSNTIKLFSLTILTIFGFWAFFIAFTNVGFSFPEIGVEKFIDLGLFSVSAFGLIIFLTMVPFQTVEGKLSPAFLSRIFKTVGAHFGLYVLVISAIFCFMIPILDEVPVFDEYLSQFFIALVASIILSIICHRFWVLRSLYQPYVVYKHIKELKWEEPAEEIWLELFECSHKAIKQGRLKDAMYFIDLLSFIFKECSAKGNGTELSEDLVSLHQSAKEFRPVARLMEGKWPFLRSNN